MVPRVASVSKQLNMDWSHGGPWTPGAHERANGQGACSYPEDPHHLYSLAHPVSYYAGWYGPGHHQHYAENSVCGDLGPGPQEWLQHRQGTGTAQLHHHPMGTSLPAEPPLHRISSGGDSNGMTASRSMSDLLGQADDSREMMQKGGLLAHRARQKSSASSDIGIDSLDRWSREALGCGPGEGPQEGAECSRHLWLGNLNPRLPRQALREVLQAYGPLEDVVTFPGRMYAFVNFRSAQDAASAASALQNATVPRLTARRKLIVRVRPSRKAIGKVVPGAARAEVSSEDSDCATMDTVAVLSSDGDLMGSLEGHPALLQRPGLPELPDDLMPGPSEPTPLLTAASPSNEPTKHLWLGNIPLKPSRGAMEELFALYGRVESVRVFPGKTYAFVNYETVSDASRARRELDGVVSPTITGSRPMIIRFQPSSSAAAAAAKQEAKTSSSVSQRSSCSSSGGPVTLPGGTGGDISPGAKRAQAKLSNRLNPNNIYFDPALAERYKRMSKLEKEMLWASDRNSRVSASGGGDLGLSPYQQTLPAAIPPSFACQLQPGAPSTPVGSWGSHQPHYMGQRQQPGQQGSGSSDRMSFQGSLWAGAESDLPALQGHEGLHLPDPTNWGHYWATEPATLSSALSKLLSPMCMVPLAEAEDGDGDAPQAQSPLGSAPDKDTFTLAPPTTLPTIDHHHHHHTRSSSISSCSSQATEVSQPECQQPGSLSSGAAKCGALPCPQHQWACRDDTPLGLQRCS